MIGDAIHIKEAYFITANSIFGLLQDTLSRSNKFVIGIGGESGSGKSVTATCLQKVLEENGIKTHIIHQDDYFFYPPKTNHEMRVVNFDHIGYQEVNIGLIEQQIDAFKRDETKINKPLVNYHENIIISETIDFHNIKVLLIEGTYILKLPNLDFRIFIDRNYQDTLPQRKARGREAITPFVEKVLEKEHQLILPLKQNADLIISKDYSVITNK